MLIQKKAQQLSDLDRILMVDSLKAFGWSTAQLESEFEQTYTVYWMAYSQNENDSPVAYLAGQALWGELEFYRLYTGQNWRGQGWAKHLIEAAQQQMGRVYLEVRASNQAAVSLYEKTGFRRLGIRKDYYHHPTEDGVIMEWRKTE